MDLLQLSKITWADWLTRRRLLYSGRGESHKTGRQLATTTTTIWCVKSAADLTMKLAACMHSTYFICLSCMCNIIVITVIVHVHSNSIIRLNNIIVQLLTEKRHINNRADRKDSQGLEEYNVHNLVGHCVTLSNNEEHWYSFPIGRTRLHARSYVRTLGFLLDDIYGIDLLLQPSPFLFRLLSCPVRLTRVIFKGLVGWLVGSGQTGKSLLQTAKGV